MLELSGPPMGDYDQCLSIESPTEGVNPKIKGQYCGVEIDPYLIFDTKQYPREVFANINFNKDGFATKLTRGLFSNSIRTQDRRTYEDWLSVIAFMDTFFDKSTKIVHGLCLPSTCSPRDVSKAINECKFNTD